MNVHFPSPAPRATDDALSAAVTQMAAAMQGLGSVDLDQPWAWGPHREGVRFALLGTYQELRELAVRLAAERRITLPVTATQHALAQYHAAYRDLEAVLQGVDADLAKRRPAPGEWSVRESLGHILRAERGFFTLVHYGLRRQREGGGLPERLPEGEADRVLGTAESLQTLLDQGDLHEIIAAYAALHGRALREFAGISDQELAGPSLWWEDVRYPLQHRLHRFDAHLRQHTVQIEQALAALGHETTEARRLLRLVYSALAEVEGLLIGAADAAREERQALARKLQERSAEIAALVKQARRLQQAVQEGNRQIVSEILTAHPALADALDSQHLPLVMRAIYNRQPQLAALFVEHGAALSIFEAAALGDLAAVEQEAARYPEDLGAFSGDGFTALQLACYFGHEETARWLVENGADVSAVSSNAQQLQAIHAAAASSSAALCRILLEHGADADARQSGGYTPLHAAAQNGNETLARLLLEAGADPLLANDQGETAVDLAIAAGHGELAALLGDGAQ